MLLSYKLFIRIIDIPQTLYIINWWACQLNLVPCATLAHVAVPCSALPSALSAADAMRVSATYICV